MDRASPTALSLKVTKDTSFSTIADAFTPAHGSQNFDLLASGNLLYAKARTEGKQAKKKSAKEQEDLDYPNRQNAVQVIMTAFRNQFKNHYTGRSCARVLERIDNDPRFRQVGGNFELTVSNLALMNELMERDTACVTTIREEGAAQIAGCGPTLVKKAIEIVMQEGFPSGLFAEPGTERARDDVRRNVDRKVAEFAADALIDPSTDRMFDEPDAFLKVTQEHFELILTKRIISDPQLEGVRPWLAFYSVVAALSRALTPPTDADLLKFNDLLGPVDE